MEPMTQTPDEHTLAVEEGKVSPVVILVTMIIVLLFVVALLYRTGITIL